MSLGLKGASTTKTQRAAAHTSEDVVDTGSTDSESEGSDQEKPVVNSTETPELVTDSE